MGFNMQKIAIVIVSSLSIASASAQFVGENARSGIPSWDAAFIKAGGKFVDDATKPLLVPKSSEPQFVGENARSGIPSWDAAFIKAGGKFVDTSSSNK
jgi:hypothetical protein